MGWDFLGNHFGDYVATIAKIKQQWLSSWSWSSSSTQGWGGPPQGEDEVLRLQTSPWRQGVGGEDLYLVKHGVDDHVDVDSDDDDMMMLAIEAFAKFSVGVRLVWQKSQQWFSRSFIDLQNVLQLQDWSAKVFERLRLKCYSQYLSVWEAIFLAVFKYMNSSVTCSIWVFDKQCLILYLNTLSIWLVVLLNPFFKAHCLFSSFFSVHVYWPIDPPSLYCWQSFLHFIIFKFIELFFSSCYIFYHRSPNFSLQSPFRVYWPASVHFHMTLILCLVLPSLLTCLSLSKSQNNVRRSQSSRDLNRTARYLSLSPTLAEEVSIIRSIRIQFQY